MLIICKCVISHIIVYIKSYFKPIENVSVCFLRVYVIGTDWTGCIVQDHCWERFMLNTAKVAVIRRWKMHTTYTGMYLYVVEHKQDAIDDLPNAGACLFYNKWKKKHFIWQYYIYEYSYEMIILHFRLLCDYLPGSIVFMVGSWKACLSMQCMDSARWLDKSIRVNPFSLFLYAGSCGTYEEFLKEAVYIS